MLIVGGVAGGASCAARLRRLDESCEIVVYDRGPYASFANCGLPYHVGNVIPDERSLLVSSAEQFHARFAVTVETGTEALSVDRARRTLRVRSLATGVERDEHYDALVLSPGAAPVRPAVPGVDLPGIFAVRTIPDTRRIRAWIDERSAKRAVVVGGGFIGLEMVENLLHRGLAVTVVEKLAQVMPPLDPEMAAPLEAHLRAKGVTLALGDGLAGFETDPLRVRTESGRVLETDLVILAIGVRPETKLASSAGLPLGPRGGIVVDAQMRTEDPHIWAVGDAVEVRDVVTGAEIVLPLAGPANRQGRVAADSIAGRASVYRGVQGTAVVGLLGMTAASTGASEKGLRRAGVTDFAAVYLHPGHHAGYYPGAQPIHMKLLYEPSSGRVLGAQAVGTAGVDKRIDVIATTIQYDGTVDDLAEAELCYAPQFGAAKDPVNVAGMIASNARHGDVALASWSALTSGAVLEGADAPLVVDVREPEEFARGSVPEARNAPLSTLREQHEALPRDRELWLLCGVGQRAYFAARFLTQRGYRARVLSGGFTSYGALAGANAGPRT